jgi:DNA-directed RNA polymerase subunit RPC12/RpoP
MTEQVAKIISYGHSFWLLSPQRHIHERWWQFIGQLIHEIIVVMRPLLILLLLNLQFSCMAQTSYVCPPCRSDCDRLQFQRPGSCPTCGMKLILSKDHVEAEEFYFTFDSIRYSAEIDRPKDKRSTAIVVIIPGHGRTDFVGGSQYFELRQFFTRLGLTVISWDKRGCGRTEGNYEHHQSVESSALEAVAAIEEFKKENSTGFVTDRTLGYKSRRLDLPLDH